MTAIKTFAGFALLGAVAVIGLKAERQFDLEGDAALRPLIEQNVRWGAAGYDPKVNLTVPELKNFSLGPVLITRSRIGKLVDSTFGGGDQSYEVYARFSEGGDDKCLTLSLEWRSRSESWSLSHTGAYDRCAPVW